MKSWVCHCNVEAYDGVSTIRSRPTEVVEAMTESKAIDAVKKVLTARYKGYGCSVNRVSVALIKQIN